MRARSRRGDAAAGVGDLDHDRAVLAAAAHRDAARVRVLDGVRGDARERLLEQVGVADDREPGGQSTPTSTPVAARERRGDLLEQRRDRARAEAAAARRGASARASTSSARVSRVSRSDSRAITSRNSSRVCGLVLRAGLEHLDRGDDRRERRAQLVRGVRRELALHALVARALGLVLDDEDRVLAAGRRRDAGDERACARRRRAGGGSGARS